MSSAENEKSIATHARAPEAAALWEADSSALNVRLVGESVAFFGHSEAACQDGERFLEGVVPPEDWPQLLATVNAAATDGRTHVCEHRLVTSDGRSLDVQTVVRRRAAVDGRATLSAVTVDISALKAEQRRLREDAERDRLLIDELRAASHADSERAQQLRHSEETFRRLVETVEEYAIFAIGSDGVVESWNAGAQRMQGYRANEIIGQSAARLFPSETVFASVLADAARIGEASYEGPLVRKDSTTFWGNVTLSAVEDADGALRAFTNIARDMTERRKTEAPLRESEEHFRRMVDSVHEYALFMLSPSGVVESWNPGAQRLKRYRSNEVIGESYRRFFKLDEQTSRLPERLLEEASTQGESRYEGWLLRKGGDAFWGHLTLAAVEDDDGTLRGFSNVARDLTERRQNEETLREREEQVRMLLESLHDHAVYMVSPEGAVAGWSTAAEHLHGWREPEVTGRPLEVLFGPDASIAGVPGRLLARARAEGRAEYDGWLARKTGTAFWGNIILTVVRDKQGILRGFSNVTRDQTVRMRVERDQAFLSEASTALAASLDYGTSLENVARLATRYMADLCVVSVLVGGALQVVAVAHADPDQQRLLERSISVLPQDGALPAGPGRVVRMVRSELYADVSDDEWVGSMLGLTREGIAGVQIRSYAGVPLTTHGVALGAMSLFFSSPGRRYGSDDLLVLEELGRRAAVAVDNARSYQRSQDAVRMREEALALVSHDLGTPLSAIEMHAAALERGGEAAGASILRAVRHMNALMRDLLDFTAFEAGQLRIEPVAHEPSSIIAEAVDLVQPLADEAGVRLVISAARLGVDVSCDRLRIVRALTNIIGNGVKFTANGGAVTISAEVDGDGVCFVIADTGTGIPADEIPHIFTPYHSAGRRERHGAGLGLTIAQRIIAAHRSVLRVHSEIGKGSTFSFRLLSLSRS